jgi:NIMA (never in mitosis gene a)-related kinase
MSPEQIEELKYNEKSDIWSLGCFLYELTSLHPPFEANTPYNLAIKIKSGKVENIPKFYSKQLSDLISSLMNVNQNERPTIEQIIHLPEVNLRIKEKKIKENLKRLKNLENELNMREMNNKEREDNIIRKEKYLIEKEKNISQRENYVIQNLENYHNNINNYNNKYENNDLVVTNDNNIHFIPSQNNSKKKKFTKNINKYKTNDNFYLKEVSANSLNVKNEMDYYNTFHVNYNQSDVVSDKSIRNNSIQNNSNRVDMRSNYVLKNNYFVNNNNNSDYMGTSPNVKAKLLKNQKYQFNYKINFNSHININSDDIFNPENNPTDKFIKDYSNIEKKKKILNYYRNNYSMNINKSKKIDNKNSKQLNFINENNSLRKKNHKTLSINNHYNYNQNTKKGFTYKNTSINATPKILRDERKKMNGKNKEVIYKHYNMNMNENEKINHIEKDGRYINNERGKNKLYKVEHYYNE